MGPRHGVIWLGLALAAATGVAAASVGGAGGGEEPPGPPRPPQGVVVAEGSVVREGAGPARVVVRRGPGAPARFTWSLVPGSAEPGEDYEGDPGVVQFQAGEHSRTIEIPVRDDGRVEGTETFGVRLDVMPGMPEAQGGASTTVTIADRAR